MRSRLRLRTIAALPPRSHLHAPRVPALALLLAALLAAPARADEPVRIATNIERSYFPPAEALLRKAYASLGLAVEFVPWPLPRAHVGLRAGNLDGVAMRAEVVPHPHATEPHDALPRRARVAGRAGGTAGAGLVRDARPRRDPAGLGGLRARDRHPERPAGGPARPQPRAHAGSASICASTATAMTPGCLPATPGTPMGHTT